MANIIRCKLPDGVHRFKPFTVADYRDFLLVRNDIQHRPEEEQREIIAELISDYFSEYPKTWQAFIFLQVYSGSIGKTKVPVTYTCPTCGKERKSPFTIYQDELKAPEIEVAGIKIRFTFPETYYENKAQMISENISEIFYENHWIKWKDLSEDNQVQIIDAIDIESLETVISKMNPIDLHIKFGCCINKTKKYTDIVEVFKLLVNPDEIFMFYQINHLLVKNNYTLDSIMGMIPVERNISLTLVEKDSKK